MCGACGGGRAGPSWEDAAGRVDAVGARARVRAVERLNSGSRWQVRAWRGSWTATAPSGRVGYARTLDELFAMLPAITFPRSSVEYDEAVVPRPEGWHVQAALVWAAAARAAGVCAQLVLPVDGDRSLRIGLRDEGVVPEVTAGTELVRIAGPCAPALLDSLMRTAAEERCRSSDAC